MNFKHIYQSKTAKRILLCLLVILVLAVVFHVGVMVGIRKARFMDRFGITYMNNFGRSEKMFKGKRVIENMMMPERLQSGHGVVGKVVSIQDEVLIVVGSGTVEKIVRIKDTTIIKKSKNDASVSDIIPNTHVAVIGSPNEKGEIEAKFIRILPNPEQSETPVPFNK